MTNAYHIAHVEKAYKECLRFLQKKRKTVPVKSLDTVLYVVEKYLRWVKED